MGKFLFLLAFLGAFLLSTAEVVKNLRKDEDVSKFVDKQKAFTFPKGAELFPKGTVGNYSIPELKLKAYPCGTLMSEFNGIGAYSNGDYQGTGDSCSGWSSTGLQFQCVEYTQRYFNYLYGVAPVWPVNFASQMCSSYPGGVTPVGYPQVGFGVVFGWGYYGHTAVVTGVGASTINVIEQNGSPYGTNSYYQSDVLCYLAPN